MENRGVAGWAGAGVTLWIWSGFAAVGCGALGEDDPAAIDADGDGYSADVDCDDGSWAIHPGADEECDGLDEDCDGEIDEFPVNGIEVWPDADGDGHGTQEGGTIACELGPGLAADGADCDDDAGDVYPGAPEHCDGMDEDCDGEVDEEAVDAPWWFTDADGDGVGDAYWTIESCTQPPNHVSDHGDCDDSDPDTWPGAEEVCDGADNDCDGELDEGFDADGDGASPCYSDCNDALPSVGPDAMETCDGIDNDCDDAVDDDPVDAPAWHPDEDADGWGAPILSVTSCVQPTAHVADSTDCNDADPSIHPGAADACGDLVDQDCDGSVDDAEDADDDGTDRCGGDCDDTDAAVHPGAVETCDAIDEDCDGETDEDATGATTWYFDGDGDGFGLDSGAVTACDPPASHASQAGDCDDASAAVRPGATEDCGNARDEDCDGLVDEAEDEDGDGFTSCVDCDDGDAGTAPGAPESCDGEDEDCDGMIDEEVAAPWTWYRDADGDGHGDPTVSASGCVAPFGYVGSPTDCDDTRATASPGAAETCGNAVDDDCDGAVDEGFDEDGDGFAACAGDCDDADAGTHPGAGETCDGFDEDCDGAADEGAEDPSPWYRDADADGFGNGSIVAYACTAPAGHVGDSADCDDSRATVNPGAEEVCGNGLDDDCDNSSDEGFDLDFDGVRTCAGDCDDTDPSVWPGAAETCDGVDEDCDGEVDAGSIDGETRYPDGDGDGFGVTDGAVALCVEVAGHSASGGDCDDTRADVHPGAAEVCGDGVDDDCDLAADDGCAGTPGVFPLAGAYATMVGVNREGVGGAVAGVGDLDEDGLDDLVVGAPDSENWGAGNAGAVYVYLGPTVGGRLVPADAEARLTGGSWDRAGGFLAPTGDIDGDGDAEIAIGGASSSTYTAWIVEGPVSGTVALTAADARIGDAEGDTTALVVADFDGDGEVDIARGASGYYGGGGANGIVQVVEGPLHGTFDFGTPQGSLLGGQYSLAGDAVAAGDYDGDGQDDLVVGAPGEWDYPHSYGAVYVWTQAIPLGGQVDDAAVRLADDRFGQGGAALAAGEDIDGDGFDDLLVGAPEDAVGNYRGGAAVLFHGPLAGDLSFSDADSRLAGTWPIGFAGRAVSFAGDVDGDGYGDLLVAAPEDGTAGLSAGAVFLVLGPIAGDHLLVDVAAWLFVGSAEYDFAGTSVSSAGDVDGDGLGDLLVGAPGYSDDGYYQTGAAYLVLGSQL